MQLCRIEDGHLCSQEMHYNAHKYYARNIEAVVLEIVLFVRDPPEDKLGVTGFRNAIRTRYNSQTNERPYIFKRIFISLLRILQYSVFFY